MHAGHRVLQRVSQYDSWKPGRFAAEGKVGPAPFCIDELDKFTATYTAAGEPSQFARRPHLPPHASTPQPKQHDDHRQPPAAARGRPGLPDRPRLRAEDHGPHARRHDRRTTPQAFVPTERDHAAVRGRVQGAGRDRTRSRTSASSGFFAPTPVTTGDGRHLARPRRRSTNPVLGHVRLPGRPHRQRRCRSRSTRWTPSKMTQIGAWPTCSDRPDRRSSPTASR